jgi:hypothetical protein
VITRKTKLTIIINMYTPGITMHHLIYTFKIIPENGVVNGGDGSGGIKGQCGLPGNLHLGPANMLLLEQELTVQIAHLNGVQVNLNQNSATSNIKYP